MDSPPAAKFSWLKRRKVSSNPNNRCVLLLIISRHSCLAKAYIFSLERSGSPLKRTVPSSRCAYPPAANANLARSPLAKDLLACSTEDVLEDSFGQGNKLAASSRSANNCL